jgi:hypothetical protein
MAQPTPEAQRFAVSCTALAVAGAFVVGATPHAQLRGSVDAATSRIYQAVQIPERAAQAAIDQERQVHEAAARGSASARDEQHKLVEAERVAQDARDQFRSTYQRALDELKVKTDAGLTFYQRLFTCLAMAGILFALLSTVSGFVKWSMMAGIEASLLEHPSQSDVDRWKDRFLKLADLLSNPPSVKDPEQLTKSIVQGG